MCSDCIMGNPIFKKGIPRKMMLKWSTLGLCSCCSLYLERPCLPLPHITPKWSSLSTGVTFLGSPSSWPRAVLSSSSPGPVVFHHVMSITTYILTLCCTHLLTWVSSLYAWASWVSVLVIFKSFHPSSHSKHSHKNWNHMSHTYWIQKAILSYISSDLEQSPHETSLGAGGPWARSNLQTYPVWFVQS